MTPYRKDGDEYEFTFMEAGHKFTVRAKITKTGGHTMQNGDRIDLFPERSSGHKRVVKFLEEERSKAK